VNTARQQFAFLQAAANLEVSSGYCHIDLTHVQLLAVTVHLILGLRNPAAGGGPAAACRSIVEGFIQILERKEPALGPILRGGLPDRIPTDLRG
jgi:hypothetical protein